MPFRTRVGGNSICSELTSGTRLLNSKNIIISSEYTKNTHLTKLLCPYTQQPIDRMALSVDCNPRWKCNFLFT